MALRGDNPIKTEEEDTLGRRAVAESLAREVRTADASEGSVIAVVGPWGSGKTSILNLTLRLLAEEPELPVLNFNPWMFAGTSQLVDSFFAEIAAQLKLKKGKYEAIGDQLERYGNLLSPLNFIPIAGSWLSGMGKLMENVKKLQGRADGDSAESKRNRLTKALKELDTCIVVVIDDIDRLNAEEIRDIFRLVRLTASFPNIVYVLAFDRLRVEQALGESGISGRDYLEKIVQAIVRVPEFAGTAAAARLVLQSITEAVDGIPDLTGKLDVTRWSDVFAEVIFPLIGTMRDVKRYAIAVRAAVSNFKGTIQVVDLLALEAIHTFMPDVFALLARTRKVLTNTSRDADGRNNSSQVGTPIGKLLEAAGDHDDIVRALIYRLFPAALQYMANTHYGPEHLGEWIKARRVAHPDILSLYFERTANAGLESFNNAERAFVIMQHGAALDAFLRSLDIDARADVVFDLLHFKDDFPTEAALPASAVLLNLMPDLPRSRGEGILGMQDPRSSVRGVVAVLLKQVGTPAAVGGVLAQLHRQIKSLSSVVELIQIVGPRADGTPALADEAVVDWLKREVCSTVAQASASELAGEWNLLRLLLKAEEWKQEGQRFNFPLDDPMFVAALLKGATVQATRQSLESRHVVHSQRLVWDALIQVYGGDQERLRNAIAILRRSDPDAETMALVELAEKYLSGWRPEDDD